MISPVGFLYSQIGYDLGSPQRAIVRGPEGTLPLIGAVCEVRDADAQLSLSVPILHWGPLWGSHWWVADFSALDVPGDYTLVVKLPYGSLRFQSTPIRIARHLLWDKTWRTVALEQNERRAHLAMNKIGWQDCGAAWQEANSHAALVLGLCDLLDFAGLQLSETDKRRLSVQIRNGCGYLALLQDRASALGHGAGAVCHQTPTYEEFALPVDAALAVIAFARAARLLPDDSVNTKLDYQQRAEAAFHWLQKAHPVGAAGFSHSNHGVSAGFVVPTDEWMTKDLLLISSAAYELSRLVPAYQKEAIRWADAALQRQVSESSSPTRLYGHFRTFESGEMTEKSWGHHVEKAGPGADTGAHTADGVLLFLRMRETWPAHPEAARWEDASRAFAYGYFLPACQANPFLIAPLGEFEGEDLLWFAGLWHGMNTAYAQAALMALEFARFFGDPAFEAVAIGNLQWIAGLNAGITAESLALGSVMFSMDVPAGEALPCSMIHGIGTRYGGTWLNVRGSICNGFSTGAQFVYDVPPTLANDGPHSFTDEDWITHSGAWLSAVSKLCESR